MASTGRVPDWLIECPIAHRGLHDGNFPGGSVPENSLHAFELAIKGDFPIELDVHLLADGQVVVFHDHELERLTGRRGNILRLDSDSIRALRLNGTDQGIPLLSDVLRLVNGRVGLLIELKNLGTRVGPLEAAVIRLLAGYHGSYAVQSFNPLSVLYLRHRAPTICRGQLSTGRMGVPIGALTRPDFVAFSVEHLRQSAVYRARNAGVPVLAWTVRNCEQYLLADGMTENVIFEVVPGMTVD